LPGNETAALSAATVFLSVTTQRRVSREMGNSPAMVLAHYRELVKPKDAELFWNIVPDPQKP